MALFNYTAKEITLKLVYYGPGFSGKTTNLQNLHTILPSDSRGKLISLTTEADRTLFFDFLPVDIGKVKEFNIRFQLYTVPGQVRYNATRRLVLRGADAVIFVADSQKEMKDQNIESYNNMRENLTVNNIDPDEIPIIFQYNKRDVKNVMSVGELNADINKDNAPFFESSAVEGKGVKETFKEATDILIKHIAKKHKVDIDAPIEIISNSVSADPAQAAPKPSVSSPPIQSPSSQSQPRTQTPDIAPPSTRPVGRPAPAVVEKTVVQQAPTADLSGLVSVMGDLRDVLSDISSTLKDMQKKQARSSNELYEIRQTLSGAKKEGKGLKKFFG